MIDPKTMRVIEASHRWDSEKLFDPRVDGANVEDQFPPDVLGARLERFVELSTAQALCEAFGSVTVSEPRIVPSRP